MLVQLTADSVRKYSGNTCVYINMKHMCNLSKIWSQIILTDTPALDNQLVMIVAVW